MADGYHADLDAAPVVLADRMATIERTWSSQSCERAGRRPSHAANATPWGGVRKPICPFLPLSEGTGQEGLLYCTRRNFPQPAPAPLIPGLPSDGRALFQTTLRPAALGAGPAGGGGRPLSPLAYPALASGTPTLWWVLRAEVEWPYCARQLECCTKLSG